MDSDTFELVHGTMKKQAVQAMGEGGKPVNSTLL